MDWTVWTEAMYAKCGPKPTWRALMVWILDEMFWRIRLMTGDPDYMSNPPRMDYWKYSWGESWQIYFGSGLTLKGSFPRKW